MTGIEFLDLCENEIAEAVKYINNRINDLFEDTEPDYEDSVSWKIRIKIASELGESPAWISFILSRYGYVYDEEKNQYLKYLKN